jgi:hypothetical protein
MNTILRSLTVLAGAGVVALLLAFAVGQLDGASVSSAAGAPHVGVSALSLPTQHAHLAAVPLHVAPTRAFVGSGGTVHVASYAHPSARRSARSTGYASGTDTCHHQAQHSSGK